MSFTSRQAFAWVAVAAIAFVSSSARAAILYGDFSDVPPGGVMYLDVTESSSTDPVPPPRYGAPTVTGNNMNFKPKEFGALAEDGDADLFDGQLNYDIMSAVDGAGEVAGGFSSIVLNESGDFTLFGTGTAVTSVAAGIFAEVEILAVDGVALATPLIVTASTQFSTDLASSPGLNQAWSNSLLVDFAPALQQAGIDPEFGVTKASVVIDDTLAAISEANPSTVAFIAKKRFGSSIPGFVPNPNYIPEPSSVLMIGTLLAGALAYRKIA